MATRRPDVSPYLDLSGAAASAPPAGLTASIARGYVDHDVLADPERPGGTVVRLVGMTATAQVSHGYVDFDVLETCRLGPTAEIEVTA